MANLKKLRMAKSGNTPRGNVPTSTSMRQGRSRECRPPRTHLRDTEQHPTRTRSPDLTTDSVVSDPDPNSDPKVKLDPYPQPYPNRRSSVVTQVTAAMLFGKGRKPRDLTSMVKGGGKPKIQKVSQQYVPVCQTFMIKTLRNTDNSSGGNIGDECIVMVGTLIQRIVDDPRIVGNKDGYYEIRNIR